MYSIGIDLGGTNTVAGLINESGKIVCKQSISTGRQGSAQDIIDKMAALVADLIKQAEIGTEEIIAVGIGSPGLVNSRSGAIIYASNLNFHNVHLVELFGKKTGFKTHVANDADAAAYGEFIAGCGQRYEDFVTVTLGTGVGGGVIIGGKIFSGYYPGGSELGHVVIQAGGYPCNCGRQGCWEQYSSASALIKEASKAAKKEKNSLLNQLVKENNGLMDARIPFVAAKKDDSTAKIVIERYVKYLAIGLANIIHIFRPQAIALGGGISHEGDNLLLPLKLQVETELGRGKTQTDIITCELGNDAGVIGAGMLYKNL